MIDARQYGYRWPRVVIALLLLGVVAAKAAAATNGISGGNPRRQPTQIHWEAAKAPSYHYRLLSAPHRLVVDLQQTAQHPDPDTLQPKVLSSGLVKRQYQERSPYRQHTRWIFELRQRVGVTVVIRAPGCRYPLRFILKPLGKIVPELTEKKVPVTGLLPRKRKSPVARPKKNARLHSRPSRVDAKSYKPLSAASAAQPNKSAIPAGCDKSQSVAVDKAARGKVIVAIDAGHGGKDSGAIGPTGLQEKQVNLAIAQQLARLLRKDRQFYPVLTRSTDTFIAVGKRSIIARQQQAQLLISIHADGSMNPRARGVSVWVLSNQRASNELTRWLSRPQQRIRLMGGVGDVLEQKRDRYLHHAVLDLQFGHSQQVGYQVASAVLEELRKVSPPHKYEPEYASLGVLQSPDIPSLLVESGFITNAAEERLLRSARYQRRIAAAIYHGIRCYFQSRPSAVTAPQLALKSSGDALVSSPSQPVIHVVRAGETLSALAVHYQVSLNRLQRLNQLPSSQLRIGQKLRVPPMSG